VLHYNRSRLIPHYVLEFRSPPRTGFRPATTDKLPLGYRVVKKSVLGGGLHHEYRLVKEAA